MSQTKRKRKNDTSDNTSLIINEVINAVKEVVDSPPKKEAKKEKETKDVEEKKGKKRMSAAERKKAKKQSKSPNQIIEVPNPSSCVMVFLIIIINDYFYILFIFD